MDYLLTKQELFIQSFVEQCFSAMDVCAREEVGMRGWEEEERKTLTFILRTQALRVWKRYVAENLT